MSCICNFTFTLYKLNDVVTKLNSQSMSRLAHAGGGDYFELNDRSTPTDQLVFAIQEVKGTSSDSKTVNVQSNKYLYFLLPGCLLLLLDILIGIRVIKL